jgi:hypothetical protein
MEFEGKDALCRRISENGTIAQENAELKQMLFELASAVNPEIAARMAAEFGIEPMPAQNTGTPMVREAPNISATENNNSMKKAAEAVAQSTEVR